MKTDYRVFPWLKQHGGGHAGHRGAHAGGVGASKKIGGVKVDADAAEMFAAVPEPVRKAAAASGLKEVRVVNRAELNQIAGRPSPGMDITATYKDDGTLYLLKTSKEKMPGTLQHELGHALDPIGADGNFFVSESREWQAASGWKQDKKGRWARKDTITDRPVSEYGKSAPWEDFAETFKVMTIGSKFDRRVMQGESEKRYSFMKGFLAKNGIAVD